MGIRGGERARILQETMGIDTRSDTMRPFSRDDSRPPTPARTSVAVDDRVAEYVASVSTSNSPSSPKSRTDAATVPMSTAMTASHHCFLSDGMCAPERCAWRLFVLSLSHFSSLHRRGQIIRDVIFRYVCVSEQRSGPTGSPSLRIRSAHACAHAQRIGTV